ncbi:MAG: hypothetical protein AB8B87_02030 [Granulosicoccus sp.]
MNTQLRYRNLSQITESERMYTDRKKPSTQRLLMLGATLLASTTLFNSHAHAADFECESSLPSASCQLQLLPGLTLESTLSNTIEISSNEFQLTGTVTVVTPAFSIPLNNTSLTARLGSAPELYGETEVPLDQMPLLKDANFETIPRAVLGLAQSATVEELVGEPLPLNTAQAQNGTKRAQNKPYLLFHLDAGVKFSLNMDEQLELLNEIDFTIPGSLKATAILDLFDPYFYLAYSKDGGIDLNKLKRKPADDNGLVVYEIKDEKEEKVVMTFTLDTKTGVMAEQNFLTDSIIYYERNESGDFVQQNVANDPLVLEGSQFENLDKKQNPDKDNGDDSNKDDKDPDSSTPIDAIGFSANGWIPYDAADTGSMPADVSSFSGQIFLRGEIPLSPVVAINGDVVTYMGAHGLAQGGNGSVSLGIPGLPDIFDFDIELGNASAAVTFTDAAQKVFVSGEMAPDFEFLKGILPIMPTNKSRVEGYVGNDLQNTFLMIEGEMNMGADTLGQLIGVNLDSLALSRSRMIIDAHGVEISGSTRMQISPDIQLDSDVSVYASLSWNNPDDLSLEITGNMNVFGVALEDVSLEISSRGMSVNGAFVTPLTRIAMHGRIDSAGPMLGGTGSIVLDLASITASMQDANDTLVAAQEAVRTLDNQINAARAEVAANRERDQRALADARSKVSVAQSAVNSLNSRIAAEYRAINSHKSRISSKYRWYKQAKWHQRASRYASYAAEKSWRSADIARRYATIGALKGSLAVANIALNTAKSVLKGIEQAIDVTPIDLDPKVAALIVAKETALQALELARLPFRDVPFINASVSGDITLTLSLKGISGTVQANAGGASLLKGTIAFNPVPQACISVPTFGNACTKF